MAAARRSGSLRRTEAARGMAVATWQSGADGHTVRRGVGRGAWYGGGCGAVALEKATTSDNRTREGERRASGGELKVQSSPNYGFW